MQRCRQQNLKHIKFAGISVAVACATALAGCASTPQAEGGDALSLPAKDPSTTLTVLSILDPKANHVQPVIDAFEKDHPTIQLKWQTVPFDSLNSTIDSRISNKGGDPDVYWADQPRISALASRGEAQDLTSTFSQYASKFDKTAYQSGVYQDKLWALPIANSTQLLYYNADLLQKAGLDLPSASVNSRMTWEQLSDAALKAKQAGAKYGFLFGQFDRYYQLEPLPVQLGGSVGATGNGNLTPDVSSAPWQKAFDWYGSLFKSGAAPRGVTPDQTGPAFVAGDAAFMVQGPWALPDMTSAKFKWGLLHNPYSVVESLRRQPARGRLL